MKNKLIITALVLSATAAQASISLQLQFAEVFSAGGGLVPLGSKAILVASTTDNVFDGSYTVPPINIAATPAGLVGLNLTAGSIFGGDNQILQVFTADDSLGIRGFSNTFDITYSGNLGAGDQLALYWFPGLTGSTVGASQSYGFYRTSVVDTGSGGDMAFVLPTDGFPYTLAAINIDNAGIATNAEFTAIPVVPEPSTYAAIMGVAALVVVARRRK